MAASLLHLLTTHAAAAGDREVVCDREAGIEAGLAQAETTVAGAIEAWQWMLEEDDWWSVAFWRATLGRAQRTLPGIDPEWRHAIAALPAHVSDAAGRVTVRGYDRANCVLVDFTGLLEPELVVLTATAATRRAAQPREVPYQAGDVMLWLSRGAMRRAVRQWYWGPGQRAALRALRAGTPLQTFDGRSWRQHGIEIPVALTLLQSQGRAVARTGEPIPHVGIRLKVEVGATNDTEHHVSFFLPDSGMELVRRAYNPPHW